MHECPECGQACDCDLDDTWDESLYTSLLCQHECEADEDDEIGGYADWLDDDDLTYEDLYNTWQGILKKKRYQKRISKGKQRRQRKAPKNTKPAHEIPF